MTQYNPHDHYFKKAKEQGFRARSVFKLEAIQERFHVFRAGDRVLDLGAAPGSFLQYIGGIVGPKGLVIGVDLKPIKPFKQPHIKTLIADVLSADALKKEMEKITSDPFNVIVSDMAPSTSGVRFLDAGRSMELNFSVIRIAEKVLAPGGHLIIKLLSGVNEGEVVKVMKPLFKNVRHLRPSAVRKSSGEFYLIGLSRSGKNTTGTESGNS